MIRLMFFLQLMPDFVSLYIYGNLYLNMTIDLFNEAKLEWLKKLYLNSEIPVQYSSMTTHVEHIKQQTIKSRFKYKQFAY